MTQEMETFIQPKITGYRQLSKQEVDLMNEGKALAEACGVYIQKLHDTVIDNPPDSDPAMPCRAIDSRWVNIGKTDLQKGFMSLIRSIAQPTTF